MGSIVFEGIAKRYGEVYAVRGFSLTVKQGEFMTILGPSGSGKTTVLSLLAGLSAPSEGRIVVAGRDVTELSPQERKIGLVFQSYALFPHLDVFHNVAFPLSVRGLGKSETTKRVSEAMARVRLTGLERRRPGQLSGGQQQRVALARAIVFQPEILLLDEPLGALDRKLREEVQVELKTLQRELGITTLLVTHDQEEALSLSDRVVIINEGIVQQVATPAEAYRHPANEFVATFLGQTNRLVGVASPHGLRLGGGIVVPCPTQGVETGLPVLAMVRPERVIVRRDGEGLPARLRQIVYLGHGQRWYFETTDGQTIVASVGDNVAAPTPATEVRLTWSVEDAWLLQAATSSRG